MLSAYNILACIMKISNKMRISFYRIFKLLLNFEIIVVLYHDPMPICVQCVLLL